MLNQKNLKIDDAYDKLHYEFRQSVDVTQLTKIHMQRVLLNVLDGWFGSWVLSARHQFIGQLKPAVQQLEA